jgi:hypothetical protein
MNFSQRTVLFSADQHNFSLISYTLLKLQWNATSDRSLHASISAYTIISQTHLFPKTVPPTSPKR